MRKASMVVGPDKIRCIYEIQNSGQKYNVIYPFTKAYVNVFPLTNADLRIALGKMEIIFDSKVTTKGLRLIANKLFHEMQSVEGNTDKDKLENMKILSTLGHITPEGLKMLSIKLAEELASDPNGDIAINECEDKGGLLKFVK